MKDDESYSFENKKGECRISAVPDHLPGNALHTMRAHSWTHMAYPAWSHMKIITYNSHQLLTAIIIVMIICDLSAQPCPVVHAFFPQSTQCWKRALWKCDQPGWTWQYLPDNAGSVLGSKSDSRIWQDFFATYDASSDSNLSANEILTTFFKNFSEGKLALAMDLDWFFIIYIYVILLPLTTWY